MSLFIDAAFGKDTDRAPIWIMRQAGRYLPEYRAIREKHTFWEMCRTPDLVREITLQPIRRLGLDAAILFSDIMTPLPAMGVSIDFAPGPVIADPVRTQAQIDALTVPEVDEIAPYVAEGIDAVLAEVTVPLIGFAGAPLTMATYLVEGAGSKEYRTFRTWLYLEPTAAHSLLDKLTELTIRYLLMQVRAGVHAFQLFDSWAGLHDAATYATFGLPYTTRVLQAFADAGIPRIYFAVGAQHLYHTFGRLPAEVVGIDWRTPLAAARQLLPGKAVQGNLDPAALLAPPEVITTLARQVLAEGAGGAHIFNLGHGIGPETPPEHVGHLVRTVQNTERAAAGRAVGVAR